MTERNTDAVLERESAPEHGPRFWDDLTAAMAEPGRVRAAETVELPDVALISSSPRRLTLGLAAALVAVLGLLGVTITLGGGDNGAEVSVQPEPATGGFASAADGAAGVDGDVDDSVETTDPAGGSVEPGAQSEVDDAPTAALEPAEGADAGSQVDTPALEQAPTVLPDRAAELAVVGTKPERGLVWSSYENDAADCTDPSFSTLTVQGDGEVLARIATQPRVDYSGTVSHFTLSPDTRWASWLVSCGTQTEWWVAEVGVSGELIAPRLAWLGDAPAESALIQPFADSFSLNVIEKIGGAGFVAFDWETGEVSGTAAPASSLGPIVQRPLDATPDGSFSWWVAEPASSCSESEGGGLQVRMGQSWAPSGGDLPPLGEITAMAVQDLPGRAVIADRCVEIRDGAEASVSRLVIATVTADGSLTDPVVMALDALVPGHATELVWLDAQTLYFVTDNSEFGLRSVPYELVFEPGSNQPTLRKIDG